MLQHQNYPYNFQNQNTIPYQQILQANGKGSIDQLKLAPNSSVLIADSTAPIIWKCVSDSLGNVSSQAFDVTPHKDEEELRRETLDQRIDAIELQLKRIEEMLPQASG